MTKQAVSNVDFIKETYRDLLKREPDEEGLNYWIADLEERGQKKEDVIANIKLSDEYKWLQKQNSSD
tara:strand:+ start:6390 stop:6590 length:201 start_codon:yes stop_codon:yes gene_type:complete